MTATPMPAPVQTKSAIDGARTCRERGPVVFLFERPIEVNVEDVGVLGQPLQHAVRQVEGVSVDDPELPVQLGEAAEFRRQLRAGLQA